MDMDFSSSDFPFKGRVEWLSPEQGGRPAAATPSCLRWWAVQDLNLCAASGTTLCDIGGIGPIGAAIILGSVGDIGRFPTAGHFTSYNATAPIEASSGDKRRHRLNPRGNRKLNHALHIAAVSQLRYPSEGRDYYQKKIVEGKTTKEAIRALKRRISDVVYRRLLADAKRRIS
jgi:transposase